MHTKGFLSDPKEARGISDQYNPSALALFLYAIVLACLVTNQPAFAHEGVQMNQPAFAHEGVQTFSARTISQSIDPNKGPSELNHHIAGWALIGVGLLVLTNLFVPRLQPHSYIWPALFLLAGLFLMLWSDGEIWPRGNL